MNEFSIVTDITKSELCDKGFSIINETFDDYCLLVTINDVTGYVHFTSNGYMNTIPESEVLFVQELFKVFPDLKVLSEDATYELMHITDKEIYDKRFDELLVETKNRILKYVYVPREMNANDYPHIAYNDMDVNLNNKLTVKQLKEIIKDWNDDDTLDIEYYMEDGEISYGTITDIDTDGTIICKEEIITVSELTEALRQTATQQLFN